MQPIRGMCRAKFGEAAFLDVYQKLYEAPDPAPALAYALVITKIFCLLCLTLAGIITISHNPYTEYLLLNMQTHNAHDTRGVMQPSSCGSREQPCWAAQVDLAPAALVSEQTCATCRR